MEDTRVLALRRALEIFGGNQSALAEAIGKKQQTVNEVFKVGRPAPASWCVPLEQAVSRKIAEGASGEPVTREELRPDLYPPQQQAAA